MRRHNRHHPTVLIAAERPSPMPPSTLRVAVIDDSALYRQMLLNVLGRVPGAEVVGTAATGDGGVELVARTRPDVVTLDVQMPGMDGIEVLREFRRRGLTPLVVMVSSLTAEGAPTTVAALMEGAFDYVLKPSGSFAHENREQLHAELTRIFETIQTTAAGSRSASAAVAVAPSRPIPPTPVPRYDAIAIGTSTGGPQALRLVVPALPADLPVPVFVVQHIPAEFSASLAARLAGVARLPVAEATEAAVALPGHVYLAPGGRHLLLARTGDAVRCRLDDASPVMGCRPSFDRLLETATEAYGGRVLAAVLTGMGSDGLAGCRTLAAHGGCVLAEAASSCVVYGMPKAVIDAGVADEVVPLPEIAACLIDRLGGRGSRQGHASRG